MTDQPLAGRTIAILVANGFEETEMTEPQRALLGAGAALKLVSSEQGLVNGWHDRSWGHYFPVDVAISEALAADFDGLLIPGGQRGIEKLAQSAHVKRFLKGFVDGNKPVAAVGHAPALLIAAERAQGRTVAANEEIRDLLTEAGATLAGEEETVTIDRSMITATSAADMRAFKDDVLKLFTDAMDIQAAA